jgi:hypothetical protein
LQSREKAADKPAVSCLGGMKNLNYASGAVKEASAWRSAALQAVRIVLLRRERP